jgi:short-subunit dehydrogenase
MIERRKGHIVSVSSLITKCTVFNTIAYTTTKFAAVGFMDSLYDELCFNGYDEYIKTSIVFPSFVATQRKHSEMVETISDMPRSNANEIGELIVKGILQNRRKFVVPQSNALLVLFR